MSGLLSLPKAYFKPSQMGFDELLPYAVMIEDGIILTKDGSFLASWFYKGPDISSTPNAILNKMAFQTNSVLRTLGTGWTSYHDAIRLETTQYPKRHESHFQSKVPALIDEERRFFFSQEGQSFESIYALTLTYTPSSEKGKGLQELIFTNTDQDQLTSSQQDTLKSLSNEDPKKQKKSKKAQKAESFADKELNYFKESIEKIESFLQNSLEIERMTSYEYEAKSGEIRTFHPQLQYLKYCISGDNHAINFPEKAYFLDTFLASEEFFSGLTPKIGDKFIGTLSIDSFPGESYPSILYELDQLPYNYRWSTRFIYMDTVDSLAQLKKQQKKWAQRVRSFTDQLFNKKGGKVNQDALSMVQDLDQAIFESSSQLVRYGYYTSVLVFMDKELSVVEQALKEARKMLQNAGFSSRIEKINAVEAYLGTLPGLKAANVRRPMLHTFNLSHLLPLSSIWPGLRYSPCPFYPENSPPLFQAPAAGSTPFNFNLHVGDVGHTLIFGPTGSGKSTLLALIVAQFLRYPRAQIFAFDKGRSLMPLCLSSGGTFYDILGDDEKALQFCPLGGIDDLATRTWAKGWIESLLEMQGFAVDYTIRAAIHDAMELTAQAPKTARSLSDFQSNLAQSDIRKALDYYTLSGPMGMIYDSTHDSLEEGYFEVFEIENLMGLGEKNALPALLYLFHQIEKRLKGQPTLLVLDEAWLMLGHPVFREKIREWLKVLRKSNCAVIMATQSLSDVSNSGILDVLQENCPTKLYLPNPTATQQGSYDLYSSMGLNDKQIELISLAIPKRQYYYQSSYGTRLFELGLGPITLSFVGASDKDSIKRINELQDNFQDDWPKEWLKERNISFQGLWDLARIAPSNNQGTAGHKVLSQGQTEEKPQSVKDIQANIKAFEKKQKADGLDSKLEIETTNEAPTETTNEAPTETTNEAPTETTNEAPTETTSEVPTETTSEVPMKDSNLALEVSPDDLELKSSHESTEYELEELVHADPKNKS